MSPPNCPVVASGSVDFPAPRRLADARPPAVNGPAKPVTREPAAVNRARPAVDHVGRRGRAARSTAPPPSSNTAANAEWSVAHEYAPGRPGFIPAGSDMTGIGGGFIPVDMSPPNRPVVGGGSSLVVPRPLPEPLDQLGRQLGRGGRLSRVLGIYVVRLLV